jgi:hypothetical protein
MNIRKLQNLINECKQIEEDSMYNAEVHYLMGAKLKRKAFWFKFIPLIIAVVAAFFLIGGAPDWFSWITLIGGLIAIASTLKGFERDSNEHFSGAQDFTGLKHDAKSLYKSFRNFLKEKDFFHETKRLREKYNLLAKMTLPTDDKKSWDQARESIKSGRHKADFRERNLRRPKN